jgi:hypothetical protein
VSTLPRGISSGWRSGRLKAVRVPASATSSD